MFYPIYHAFVFVFVSWVFFIELSILFARLCNVFLQGFSIEVTRNVLDCVLSCFHFLVMMSQVVGVYKYKCFSCFFEQLQLLLGCRVFFF